MDARITEIRHFMSDNFMMGEDLSFLSDQDSLIDNAIVDSLGIVQLVDFIQENYVPTEICSEEIVPKNFDSIQAIVNFIESKKVH